jgi:hypothetical protein
MHSSLPRNSSKISRDASQSSNRIIPESVTNPLAQVCPDSKQGLGDLDVGESHNGGCGHGP